MRDPRGALTLRLVNTREAEGNGGARAHAIDVAHSVVLMVYGASASNPQVARRNTLTLSERVWRLLHGNYTVRMYAPQRSPELEAIRVAGGAIADTPDVRLLNLLGGRLPEATP